MSDRHSNGEQRDEASADDLREAKEDYKEGEDFGLTPEEARRGTPAQQEIAEDVPEIEGDQDDPVPGDPRRPDPTRPDPNEPDPTRPDPGEPDPTRPDPGEPDPTRPFPEPTQPDPLRPFPEPTRPDPTRPLPDEPAPPRPW
ncbi:hypothetical protein [Glycomyces sp. NRRL B-16210]|uniref:hypothetical protein n=1 Tax=Glycomyces sp. NRRL B-16210 TaxID=1463821 RepID=UPI0004C1C636|nr:hypothetical protein [Glycomyces sp. NRRL B-16210]